LNKLLYELKDVERVKEALAHDASLVGKYRLSPDEVRALEQEDLVALYHLGANPYMIRNVYRKKYRY